MEAEKFRKITMKVLTMQLNSITIMDLIAYGGAALGVILAVTQYRAGPRFPGRLPADYPAGGGLFPPHAAARLLFPHRHERHGGQRQDLPPAGPARGRATGQRYPRACRRACRLLRTCVFPMKPDREILHGVDLWTFPRAASRPWWAKAAAEKSTVASILMGRNKGYTGSVTDWRRGTARSQRTAFAAQHHLCQPSELSVQRHGAGKSAAWASRHASDDELWAVLERVNLAGFLKAEQGLDTPLLERAANLSGGQCQRLALARALLHDSPVYIFDEATSNIDVESENDIMAEIHAAGQKQDGDPHLSPAGECGAGGQHLCAGWRTRRGTRQRMKNCCNNTGCTKRLWNAQQALENYGKEG